MNRNLSLILALLILAGTVSCGDGGEQLETTTGGTDLQSDTDYSYPYPEKGYGGEEFSILNMEDIFSMHCQILREEINGDILDDAIFNRNRLIEDKFGITIKETLVTDTWELKATPDVAQKSILADDGAYDLMFLPLGGTASLISDGAFYDLTSVKSVQLDKEWWYGKYNDAIALNGKLYGAMGSAHLCILDAVRVIAFNSDMMTKLGLELPYDAVRNGKWTIDIMNEYMTKAANLNGDESAAWLKDGKTVYGFSNNKTAVTKFMQGFGENMVDVKDGRLTFTAGSEHFYDCISKLAKVLTTSDAKAIDAQNGNEAASDDGNVGFLYVFTSQRALFADAEVNKFQGFRSLNFEYGVLPYPKYDENQEEYACNTWHGAPAAFIPITSRDPEKVGLILDAMAYEGEKSVSPAFRFYTVEQKGLRNDDSIEMLSIITQNFVPVYYALYGISSDIMTQAGKDAWKGENSTASMIASLKPQIEEQISEVMEKWK